MASQLSAQSDFVQTFAVHLAIKAALKSKQFRNHASVRQAAEKLCRTLEGEKSIYGRQLRMIQMMEKGATLPDMGKKLHCSRRTIFRYLNHLDDAGVSIRLQGTKYHVDKAVAKLVKI